MRYFRLERSRYFQLETSHYFRLETSGADPPTDLFLVLTSGLDRESTVEHRTSVTACDGGRPRLTARLDVVVVITDANDHPPVFERSVYSAKVTENCDVGTTVMRLSAEDRDEGDNGRIVYSLLKTTPVMSELCIITSVSSKLTQTKKWVSTIGPSFSYRHDGVISIIELL